MASKKVILRGELFWARVQEGNHDEYSGQEFYKVTLVPDDESWVKFSKTGSSLQVRPASPDDDRDSLTFRRDIHGKEIPDKKTGKKVILGGGPPRVMDADGQKWDPEVLIGNGSLGEVMVEFYTSAKTKRVGHRLEGIKVLDLVHYAGSSDWDEDEDVTPDETPDEEEKPVRTSRKSNKDIPF